MYFTIEIPFRTPPGYQNLALDTLGAPRKMYRSHKPLVSSSPGSRISDQDAVAAMEKL